MDSSTAGDSAANGRTVGGRPVAVNFSGHRGRPPKKPSFARDDRLARDGARLMTGPFHPPSEPPVFTPAATATAAPPPAPAPAAATASSTAVALDLTSSNDNYSQDSDVEVVGRTPRPAGNKGKTLEMSTPRWRRL